MMGTSQPIVAVFVLFGEVPGETTGRQGLN